MYAQVVVLTYQPPDIDYYTYKVPNELQSRIQVGQLVEVPFGKRNPQGIVLSLSSHPRESEDQILNQVQDDKRKKEIDKNIIVKPISKIPLTQPLLLPYQIELVKWMSSYYIAPMVNCLEAVLPNIPKRVAQLEGIPTAHRSTNGHLASNELVNRALAGRKVVTGPAQSIVTVPNINKIAETLAKFPKAKNYVVYTNELKASEKFTAWQKILSGQADYIFGSRSAIFAPCPNLKEIIIYDEHDSAYKDERSPYFDTLTIAQKIAEFTKAQLKIVDPSPKITTYFQLKNNIKIQKFIQEVQIVNMQNEKTSGRNSTISFDLEEEINKVLEENGNILLFLNKKKEAGHLFCKSCKNSQYLNIQPNACPNCQSREIFWNVLNINSLALEVKKLFPKANIAMLANPRGLSFPTPRVDSANIDIGTAFALYAPLVKKYDLIAHIQTDSLLNLADYTSGEKLFAQITQLKRLLTENGKLILQTYNPEHPIITSVEEGNYQSFFQLELGKRKLMSYPPYSLLIKLTLKGKADAKVKTEAESLATLFKSSTNREPTTVNRQLSILGPYQSVFWQNQVSYHIILKYPTANYSLSERQKAVREISELIKTGSKTFQIEIEPDGIQ